MEQLLGKFRVLYGRAGGILERWSAAQARSAGLLASAASVVERLPSLADDARFGPLAAAYPRMPATTRDAQAEALDRIMSALAEELSLFHDLVASLDKIHRDASQLLLALQPPPKAAGGVRRGPQPSLVECVVGLQDLWRIHRDEALLKHALVMEFTCDAGVQELSRGVALFSAEPNLDPGEVRGILDRVPLKSTTADLK
mmetsp:Transcript_4234/g.10245  ORF Transcript_4234/g.10245 Transcript_4234/m.10245 type:complete len:200 (-) Transcript_4234:250-849(-)